MANLFYSLFDDDEASRPALPAAPTPALQHSSPPAAGNAYAMAALHQEAQAVASAPEGTRNDTLNIAAFNLGQLVAGGELDEDLVVNTLFDCARTAGLPEAEIRRTIASGISSGKRHPRRTPAPAVITQISLAGSEPAAPGPGEDLTAWIEAAVRQERVRRLARRTVDAEEAAAGFRPPPYRPTLTEELAIPDEPIRYRVQDVLPMGGNVLFTAQYKTGKTTLVNDLARSLADGKPFLQRFEVTPPDGRIAIFNYEVDERQYRRWLRECGIQNTDKVCVLNLRGFRLPVTVPHIEDWTVNYLIDREVDVWIVDPFARAFTGCGTSENDNTEVGRFLDTLDVIKQRAGVQELILPTHTGRAEFEPGQERARGATRLDDWADVRWILTRDDEGVRYFSATGRDVEVDEEMITYEPDSRMVIFGGWDRRNNERRRLGTKILDYIRDNPGASQNEIVKATGKHHRNVTSILEQLVSAGKVIIRPATKRGRANTYWPPELMRIED